MADEVLPAPVTTRSRSGLSDGSGASSWEGNTGLPVPEVPKVATDVPASAKGGLPTSIGERLPYEHPFSPDSYLQRVKLMAADVPTLHGLCVSDHMHYSKYDIDVIVLDIKEGWKCLETIKFDSKQRAGDSVDGVRLRRKKVFTDLKSTLEQGRPPDTVVRLVLVEGLSLATVEALGSALDLDPRFFAKQRDFESYYPTGIHEGSFAFDIETRAKIKCFQEDPQKFFSMRWKRAFPRNQQFNAEVSKIKLVDLPVKAQAKVSSLTNQEDVTSLPWEYFKEHVEVIAAEERLTFLEKGDDLGLTDVFLFSRPQEMSSDENEEDILNHRTIYSSISLNSAQNSAKLLGQVIQADTSTTRTQFLNYLVGLEPKTRATIIMRKNFNLSTVIFHLILPHWRNVLSEMDKFLDVVGEQFFNNQALQTKTAAWRTVLGCYSRNLRLYRAMINEILEEIQERELRMPGRCFDDLPGHVASLMERTENMFSIVIPMHEGERAIRQAESITRLTELAFFFIPLSFATSVFGMDIPGWSENYRPYMFGVIAASFLCGAYGFRLLVRSQILQKSRRLLVESVRRENHLSAVESIPTTSYLHFLVHSLVHYWHWTTFLLSCAASISLGLLWTRNATLGVKIGISVIVAVIMFTWLTLTAMRVLRLFSRMNLRDFILLPVAIFVLSVLSPLRVIGSISKSERIENWIQHWIYKWLVTWYFQH